MPDSHATGRNRMRGNIIDAAAVAYNKYYNVLQFEKPRMGTFQVNLRGHTNYTSCFGEELMNKALIMFALSGMLIPATASAEFNYNALDIGHSSTNYNYAASALSEVIVGYTRSTSKNVYLGAFFGLSNQPGYSGNDKSIYSISARAGYHIPLNDHADTIVEGGLVLGSAKQAGQRTSANGYDFGVGIRALFIPGLEGTLGLFHARTSDGTYTSKDTFIKARFGFNFLPKFQLIGGLDFKSDLTTYLGVRFYY